MTPLPPLLEKFHAEFMTALLLGETLFIGEEVWAEIHHYEVVRRAIAMWPVRIHISALDPDALCARS